MKPAEIIKKSDRVRVYFTVVRDPLEKLWSAYRMFNSNPVMADALKLQKGADGTIAFETLADHVLSSRPAKLDQHLRPQSALLRWALPALSFIARCEDLKSDLHAGLVEHGCPDWLSGFPDTRYNASQSLPRTQLDTARMVALKDYYRDDFELFRYA